MKRRSINTTTISVVSSLLDRVVTRESWSTPCRLWSTSISSKSHPRKSRWPPLPQSCTSTISVSPSTPQSGAAIRARALASLSDPLKPLPLLTPSRSSANKKPLQKKKKKKKDCDFPREMVLDQEKERRGEVDYYSIVGEESVLRSERVDDVINRKQTGMYVRLHFFFHFHFTVSLIASQALRVLDSLSLATSLVRSASSTTKETTRKTILQTHKTNEQ